MEAPNIKLHGNPSGSRPVTFGPDGGRMDMTKEYVGAFRDYASAYKNVIRNYAQHKS